LCPATFFCTGGAAKAQPCIEGTFAPAGANSSSACASAVYVEVQVQLYRSLADTANVWETKFIIALAASCSLDPSNILLWSIQVGTRSSTWTE
jgi:hypothetical protein